MAIIWFPIIICLLLVSLFLLLFIFLYSRLNRQFGKGWEFTFVFALFAICIAGGYFFWLLRIILVPNDAPIDDWIWLWRLSTLMHVAGAFFLGVFVLIFANIEKKKRIYSIFLIPLLIALIDLFIIIQPENLEMRFFQDITTATPGINGWILAMVIFVYSIIPCYYFFHYIKINPDKNSTNVKKAYFLLTGILVFTFGIIIETAKYDLIVNYYDGLGLEFTRLWILMGNLFILWAFLKYQSQIEMSFS
ncbi:MAG: hypothetical protein ACXAC7_03815 [Candidatus Hodarchaeales archaeon]|jgi:hypothetical protein